MVDSVRLLRFQTPWLSSGRRMKRVPRALCTPALRHDGTYWVTSPVRCGPGGAVGTCNRLPSGDETALPIGSNYEFGSSVALAGDWLFVGAPGATVELTTLVGAVYVYKKSSSGTWDFNTALKPNSTYAAQHMQFGRSISVSGNYAIVGSVLNMVGRMFVYNLASGVRGAKSTHSKVMVPV